MNNAIPKNLFMIWLGDKVPSYAYVSIDAYKLANPDFNVQFIHFDIMHLQSIYDKKITTKLEKILYDSMQSVLQTDANDMYANVLKHLQDFYGKSIRFIQILSDIYRLKVISEFGGIYVDCDTFPLKPFDDKLLQLLQFMVARHYDNDAKLMNTNIGDDNYFFGSTPKIMSEITTKLLLTNNRWWINIQYLMNKKLFYSLKLQYSPKIDLPFYIEHYCDGNWKMVNGRIRTQECFLDNFINNEYEHISS